MLPNLLNHLLILFICSLATLAVLKKVGINSSVGYIIVGILVGPYILNVFPRQESTRFLAEIGIALLMFTVGLEFSFSKLVETKKAVFYTGGLQTAILFLFLGGIFYFLKLNILQTFLLAGAIAMSSTAIVTKQLANLGELYTESSRMTIGVLLFQDIATLPILIILSTSTEINNSHQLMLTLLRTLPLNLIALVGFFLCGRWLFKPFIHYMAHLRSSELFMLTSLTTLILTSWISVQFNIELPLGAFIVGMVLGETTLKHQLEEDLRPFREVLVGVFFISIGAQFNPYIFFHQYLAIVLITAGIVLCKALVSILSGLMTKHALPNTLKAAISLAHTGEFGLLILTSAMERHLLESSVGQVFLAAILISIFISPFLIGCQNEITNRLLRLKKLEKQKPTVPAVTSNFNGVNNHIIICGFGKIGLHLSQWLRQEKIPFTIIDYDIQKIQLACSLGYEVVYGDATRLAILEKSGLEKSGAVAITLASQLEVHKIAHAVKTSHPNTLVIARAKDVNSIQEWRNVDIDIIFPESIELSLIFGRKLFLALGYSADKVEFSLNKLMQNKISEVKRIYETLSV